MITAPIMRGAGDAGNGPLPLAQETCRRWASALRLLLALSFAIALAGLPQSALAHRMPSAASLNENGIAIPDVTHGEMAVLAIHADAIRALAAAQSPTDPTFRRLANFAELQRTYCLWGLMPGSVADEASPFNECSHASLAALKAVLLHMRRMPQHDAAVDGLADAIEAEMLMKGASLVLCRYSSESFNTAGLIVPDWHAVPGHAPSMLALGGALALGSAGAGLTAFGLPMRRRRSYADAAGAVNGAIDAR